MLARSRVVSQVPFRALVVLRVPRGAPTPGEAAIRAAIEADRARLAMPPVQELAYRVAGPYAIEVGGLTLDEYVAWEV